MRKLSIYSTKSDLMNVRIKIGPELFKFNLYEELKVDENIINDEISSQPSIQAFLGVLLTKLDRIKSDKEAEVDKIYASTFLSVKSKIDSDTFKMPSDEVAKQKAISSERYQKALSDYNQAKENWSTIKNCFESFSQRAFLIQTLSANIRKSS